MATGFGAGYAPVAPGTAGSLVGLIGVFLIHDRSPIFFSAFLLAVFAIGVYASGDVERSTGEKDSRIIVIDEIAGMLVVGFLLPEGPGYLIAGFLLFRLLDILKPFPAGWMERRMKGGWGVMLDDIVAGVYANLILQGANLFLGS